MRCYIKGGIVGGIILFIWGIVSWVALPWHMSTIHAFQDEKVVSETLVTNAPQSGIFFLPSQMTQNADAPVPVIFISIFKEGNMSMMVSYLISFLTQVIAAMLVAWMLTKASRLNYWGKVWFAVMFAVSAGLVTHGMSWNWLSFDTNYTLVLMADLVIGWFLAGLAMAKICRSDI